MAIQLGLLLRSRGVGLSAYFSMVVASSLFAPVIYYVQQGVMAAFGWNSYSGEASVLLAGPSEETLKLLPLVAVLVFARNRAERFGIADHILLGVACGVGFGLTENVTRALTDYSSTGLLDLFTTTEDGVGHQYSLFTLFPGWAEGWGGEGAGHAVWSGLVGGGIGVARRYGRVLFSPLVLFLLAWVTLDHMAYNQAASLGAGDLIPEQVLLVHDLAGSGAATRPALLVMVVLAVWLDYRTLRKADHSLPPFPERKGAPSTPSSAFGSLWGELQLQWRVLRSDRSAFPQAMAFVRSRRELGYGLHRAAGGPRRNAPPGPVLWETGARLHNVIAAGVLALLAGGIVLTLPGGGGETAFLAPRLEDLAGWWNGLNPAQQLLITAGGTAALMLIPGVGFFAALGWATTATSFAASGRSVADFLRDPKRWLSERSPGEMLISGVLFAFGRKIHLPGYGGRRSRLGPADTPQGKQARWQEYQKRIRNNPNARPLTYDEWSNVYDRNIVNTHLGNRFGDEYWLANGFSVADGWKRELSLVVDGRKRSLDIANAADRVGYEMKSGRVDMKHARLEANADAQLIHKEGWDIRWVFKEQPSRSVIDMLEQKRIPWEVWT
ncbi:PrsW family glutamic-type intramembrane protease [Nocardiopsis suaedae]|uniref:PrsW family glutamic-type intramembrane protease n=1 Tax=Nocardiopsis suaedae TaxID=3018444 RepID=A0ABT4TWQ5_9ACTN|nr:PrsW family glutamic-type intramembrane protease [Nocardiopsis suaedae]MDA2808557.1 PrsW family glutamic-type intramembrane protease [Nocardiopsis suaedae]